MKENTIKIIIFMWYILLLILVVGYPIKKACAFDADIYGGYYFNSSMRSSPLNDGNEAEWVAGIKVGHDIDKIRLYYELETLMDSYNDNGSFHPDSIKYIAGIQYDLSTIYNGLSVDLSHMCWHPIDGVGRVEQYNLIKINYHFGE